MFKRLSLISLVMASLALTVACKSSTKKPEPPPETGAEDPSKMGGGVTNKPIEFGGGSDNGNISGLNTVHFDLDSSTLSSDTRRQLGENAEWIKKNDKVTVQIEGHCDRRGSVEYNLALGERRAKAVKTYMTSLGVPSNRMTVISYGVEKPIDSGENEQAYAKNRRANFLPISQ